VGEGPNDRGLSRKHVLSAIDASLRRLGTDYVDLYQIHRWDYETPIVGATRLGHVTDALAAAELTVSDEEARRLEEPYVPDPVLGHS
jgi:aryl-alcohol dehydrogenase-like predicted oxidoreductase